MTYVMADIHGDHTSFCEMLHQIDFKDSDTLYILGDICDRGPDAALIYLDVMECDNIICLKGNHELMAEEALPQILDISKNVSNTIELKVSETLAVWLDNGGGTTIKSVCEQSPRDRARILDFIKNMPLHATVNAGGKEFVLVHSGIANYLPDKTLDEYEPHELLWCRPNFNEKLWEDKNKYLVIGHTPVLIARPQRHPRMYFGKGNIIVIDCGNAYREQGGWLSCLCLDTMQEYYV